MNEFTWWVSQGINHLLDWEGYDHMLFLLALSCSYKPSAFKKIIILVTAFTIGHSVSLACSTFTPHIISPAVIELLIPITILITALLNLFNLKQNNKWHYTIVLGFGLLHGLGFNNYLQSILINKEDVLTKLFGFNLGLEIGQLLFLLGYFILLYLINKLTLLNSNYWKNGISLVVLIISIYLITINVF